MAKDDFCGTCGSRYSDPAEWPRVCTACGDIRYRNPTPVAVAIIPVLEGGIVLIRRAIAPSIGELALPGGYVNYGESWQEALVREVGEEMPGLSLIERTITHYRTLSSPDGGHVLIFGVTETVTNGQIKASQTSQEISEILIATSPMTLAFSTHTEVMRSYLTDHHG